MTDEDLETIVRLHSHLVSGLQRLAQPAAEQEAAEPEYVVLSDELLHYIDWPLQSLENLGALFVIDPVVLRKLHALRAKLVGLASNSETATVAAVRTSPQWEIVREEARGIFTDGMLPPIDLIDLKIRMGRG